MTSSCTAVIPVPPGSGSGLVPWFAYAILAARRAPSVGSILVVTADPAAARIAHDYGAQVAAATGDAEAQLRHALAGLDVLPDRLVVLRDGRPPATTAQIEACVAALDRDGVATALSVVQEPARRWAVDIQGLARPADTPPLWQEAEAVTAIRGSAYLQSRNLTPAPVMAVPWVADAAGHALVPPGLRALVTDFDGVMTDDAVHVDQNGIETVSCSRGDGLGLGLLQKAGFTLLILSKEPNPVVSARGRKLKIEVRQGIDDKRPELERWADANGLTLDQIAYMGNDINDLGCLSAVRWPVAPADSHPAVKRVAAYVTQAVGGRGAVREIAELMLGLA